MGFVKDTINEMKMVVWPSREALWGATKVVVGFSFLFTIFSFCCDQVLNLVVSMVF